MSTVAPVTTEMRLADLLDRISECRRPCKACGAELFFVRHRNGKLAPYTIDGVNHFLHCKEAWRFKKGGSHAAAATT